MFNRSLAILAFGVLLVFLGILVWKVPRLDLAVIVAFTLCLSAYDLYSSEKGRD